MTKRSRQSPKMRKALRSAAAKKGWETRIARERREIEAANEPIRPTPAMLEGIRMHAAMPDNTGRAVEGNLCGGGPCGESNSAPDPNPWPRMAAKIRGWLLGWLR